MTDIILYILLYEEMLFLFGILIAILIIIFFNKRYFIEPRTKREKTAYENMSFNEKRKFDKIIKVRSFMESKVTPLLAIISISFLFFKTWPDTLKSILQSISNILE